MARKTKDSPTLEAAKIFLKEYKWRPIPINRDSKIPLIKWKEFQDRSPTEAELESWWKKWPQANVGIITGEGSGIISFDVDSKEALNFINESGGFPDTILYFTRTDGDFRRHQVIFKHPGFRVTTHEAHPGLDIKGDGGYIQVPPSIHPETEEEYEWDFGAKPHDFKDRIPELPPWMIDLTKKGKGSNGNWTPPDLADLGGMRDGDGRDNALKDLCWKFLLEGHTDEYILLALEGANNRFADRLDEKDLPELVKRSREKFEAELLNPQVVQLEDIEFPEIYNGLAGEYADLLEHRTEVPKRFWFIAFLVCLSAIFGPRIEMVGNYEHPQLFVILLGDSGTTKKSTAIRNTVKLYKDFTPTSNTVGENEMMLYEREGISSDRGLIKAFKDCNDSERLLVRYDELKFFSGKAGIQGATLLSVISSLFHGNSLGNFTKDSATYIQNPFISFIGACTPETYMEIWEQSYTNIGLDNRFFIVPANGERKVADPEFLSYEEGRRLYEKIKKLDDFVGHKRVIEKTQEARDIYQEWYDSRESKAQAVRLDVYAQRFMLMLALNQQRSIVDADITRDVIALMDWQLRMRELHSPTPADNKYARMEDDIRRVLRNGPQWERDLKNLVNYRRVGIKIYSCCIDNLINDNEAMVVKEGKRGARKVALNPEMA